MKEPDPLSNLVARFKASDRRALARGITLVEEGGRRGRDFLRAVYGLTGQAHVCGITGAPGAGKSSLIHQLALKLREQQHSVAVVAVDPSSPFTGGAVLGDRVRMGAALADESVFMRSLASRGHLGGLSESARDVISVLDAFGFDIILVETVGTGQSEVEIIQEVDTVLVVSVPGLGDYVQSMKAGILEIGDVFVVNKADHHGAERHIADIAAMVSASHMGQPGLNRWSQQTGSAAVQPVPETYLESRFGSARPGDMSWRPPIVKTISISGEGVADLPPLMEQHRVFLKKRGMSTARKRLQAQVRLEESISCLAAQTLLAKAKRQGVLEHTLDALVSREIDPHRAAERIVSLGIGPDDFAAL